MLEKNQNFRGNSAYPGKPLGELLWLFSITALLWTRGHLPISCVYQLWEEADESKHKSDFLWLLCLAWGSVWQGLSSVCSHFMSCVVWELKQHLYSACLVLGRCYWVVNCNFHMNWLDFKLQEVFYKTPPFQFKVYPKGFPELVCGSPFYKHLTQHHWSQWVWSNTTSGLGLFSCHHTARGPIQGLVRSTKLSSGSMEMALQLFTLGEGSVTIGVALPFRLCSTCLLLKVKLQNQSLTFPLFILIKAFISEAWLWQIHCLLFVHLCLSSSQVPM